MKTEVTMEMKRESDYYETGSSSTAETPANGMGLNNVGAQSSSVEGETFLGGSFNQNPWSESDGSFTGVDNEASALIDYHISSMESELEGSSAKLYSLPIALSNHFSVHGEPIDNTVSAICHSCGSIVKSSLRATSNLITHLKRCDPDRYTKYCADRKSRLPWLKTRQGRSGIDKTMPTSPTEMIGANGSDLVNSRNMMPAVAKNALLPRRSEPFESTALTTVASTPRRTSRPSKPVGTYLEEAAYPEIKTGYLFSPLMKHFKLVGKPVGDSVTTRCLNCDVNVKASVKASSNLITHIKRCSPARYEQYCNDRGRKRQFRTECTAPALFQSAKNPNFPRGFGAKDSKQRRMMKHLILSIATDHLPCEAISMPNIRNLLTEADPQFSVPDLNTFSDVIVPFCVHTMEEEIRSELQGLHQIYLNLDLWTDSNSVSFLTFYVNLIDKNWNLVSRFLGAYRYESRFKASSLTSAYNDVVDKFNIRRKVTKILADNTFPFIDDSPIVTYTGWTISHKEVSSNFSDIDFANLMSFLPERIGSFSQRQQLCVVKDALTHESILSSPIATTLWKAHNLLSELLKSSAAVRILAISGVDIGSDADLGNWISLLEFASSIAQYLDELRRALSTIEKPLRDSLSLTDPEISILKEIGKVFTPFVESVRYLEGSKLSATGPVIIGLKTSLQSLTESQLVHCDVLCKLLSNAVKVRLEPLLLFDDVKIASCLDPRFKFGWVRTQNEKDEILQKLKNLMSRLNLPEVMTSHYDAKLPRMDSSLENLKSNSANSTALEVRTPVDAAISYYMEEPLSPFDTDPLSYWKSCNNVLAPLSVIAREILPSVSTSPPHDVLGNISALEKCHRAHSDETREQMFKALAFIHRNRRHFNDTL